MNKRIELSYKPNCSRRLFVVDIENAVGCGRIDDAEVVREMNRIRVQHRMSAADMVVVGVSHSSNVFPASVWKGARLVFRKGEDGADIALEDVLKKERVPERFSEVVIVSGDGLFAEEARNLRGSGVRVTVDSPCGRASRSLLLAASLIDLRGAKRLEASYARAA